VHASAINLYLQVRRPIMQEPLVKDFLKGVTNRRPRVREPFPTWDLNMVLNALLEPPYEPLEKASLKNVTIKTAFLIAITSAKRGSEIHALDVREEWCRVRPTGAYLRTNPFFLPKVRTEGNINAVISLPRLFPQPKSRIESKFRPLCVVRALEHYIKATENLRKTTQLFVLHQEGQKLGSAATKTTVARWIVSTIALAYEHFGRTPPKGLKAHSTRGMSTSIALKWGVDFTEIARAASWASDTSFIKHYRINVSGTDMGVANAVYAEQISGPPQ
jgi:hypothetical protein